MICKQYCGFVTFASLDQQKSRTNLSLIIMFRPNDGNQALQDQDYPIIVDIGPSGSSHDQIAELMKESISVMAGEQG
ncbi:hypothetical protein SAMN06298226_2973 [Nitrosovibrio sp. Nv4]|nr:hypothetical protein SAMN06298226_2973 [Nitrosovibrio sp. Nv4]